MPETTPLIKAALNLRGGAGFDVYGKRIIHVRILTNRFTIYISNMNKRVSINYRFI